MARRERNTQNTENTTATATAEAPNEVQEDTMSTDTSTTTDEVATESNEAAEQASDEAVEATAEATDEELADKPKAKEVDLTAFNEAIESAVKDTEKRDATTGELTPELIEPVNKAFRDLDGAKAKNKARAALNELMKGAMNALDMPLARSYMILSDNLSAAGGHAKAEKVPADPTEAFVQRVVGLQLAVELAKTHVPEGVNDEWNAKANELLATARTKAAEYFDWRQADEETRGEEPEVDATVKAAVKLVEGKAAKVGGSTRSSGGGSTFDGPRRDIGEHIKSAFAGVESGTFLTIAEIRKHRSEEYGDNPPSAGAIAARLNPKSGKCTVEGIEPAQNDAGRKGARKL